MPKSLNFQRVGGSAGVRSQKSQKCQTADMRNVSRTEIAKRNEDLLIVGSQISTSETVTHREERQLARDLPLATRATRTPEQWSHHI
jgi:hypothetical protein